MQEAEAGRLIRFDVNGSQRGSEGQEEAFSSTFLLTQPNFLCTISQAKEEGTLLLS